MKASDSSKNLAGLDDKDKEKDKEKDRDRDRDKDGNDSSYFKLARSMSYRQRKKSFVAKENSRGIAVSEIVLYLPLSELTRVRDSGEENQKREEKIRQELLQDVLRNYDMNNALNRERQKVNQIDIENQSCEMAFNDASQDCPRNDEKKFIESDFLNRKIIKNSDNSNLLTRAAEALSRWDTHTYAHIALFINQPTCTCTYPPSVFRHDNKFDMVLFYRA